MVDEKDFVQVQDGFWIKLDGVVYMCQRTPYKEIPVVVIPQPKPEREGV